MKPPLPPALLLDLDDTILASSHVADSCWREAVRFFADRLVGTDADTLFDAISEKRTWFWSDKDRHQQGRLNLDRARHEIVTLAFDALNLRAPDAARAIADRYIEARDQALSFLPGAREALERFRDEGIRLALVTNGAGEMQRGKIDRFNLSPFFEHIQIEGEFGAGKPDASVFRNVLRRLGVEPEDAWMVGDKLEWDVLGPQQVGIHGIWLDLHGTGLPPNPPAVPDRIIRSISEL